MSGLKKKKKNDDPESDYEQAVSVTAVSLKRADTQECTFFNTKTTQGYSKLRWKAKSLPRPRAEEVKKGSLGQDPMPSKWSLVTTELVQACGEPSPGGGIPF